MKTLFNVMVVILLLADAFGLVGCAGNVTAPEMGDASYAIDVCEHTFTAVDRFAAPSCKSGYAPAASSAEWFEGTPVTAMRDGEKVYGVVPHDASVGASVCIHVECAPVLERSPNGCDVCDQ